MGRPVNAECLWLLRLCTCLLLDGILWLCLISPFLLGLASGLQFPGLFPTLCNPTLQEKLFNYNKELPSEKLLHVIRMQCVGAEDMAPLMTCLLRYHEELSRTSVTHLTWRTARGHLPATTLWHGLVGATRVAQVPVKRPQFFSL